MKKSIYFFTTSIFLGLTGCQSPSLNDQTTTMPYQGPAFQRPEQPKPRKAPAIIRPGSSWTFNSNPMAFQESIGAWVRNDDQLLLAVTPIVLDGVSLTLEEIARAAMMQDSFDYQTVNRNDIQRYQRQGRPVLDLYFTKVIQGQNNRYFFRFEQYEDVVLYFFLYSAGYYNYNLQAGGDGVLNSITVDAKSVTALNRHSLNFRQQRFNANIYNFNGLHYYYKQQFNRAKQLFEKAYVFNQNIDFLNNAILARFGMRDYAGALSYIEPHRALLLQHPEGRANVAFAEAVAGSKDAALEIYKDIYTQKPIRENYEDLDSYVGLLLERNQTNEVVKLLEHYCDTHMYQNVVLLYIGVTTSAELTTERDTALARWRKRFDPIQHMEWDFYMALLEERYDDLKAAAKKRWAEGSQHEVTAFYIGRAHYELGEYKEALEFFEKAQQFVPSNATYNQWVTAVQSLVGKGDNFLIRAPLAPVKIPSYLLTVPDTPPTHKQAKEAYYDYVVYAYEAIPGNPMKITQTFQVRLLSQDRLKEYNQLRFRFRPGQEQIYINEMKVWDAQGNLLSEGKLNDYYVLDENPDDMAVEDKLVHIPVAGLETGCTIRCTYTKQQYASLPPVPFKENYFVWGYPVSQATAYVTGALDRVKIDTGNMPLKKTLNPHAVSFSATNLPGYHQVDFVPRGETLYPWVLIGDQDETWETVVSSSLDDMKNAMMETVDPGLLKEVFKEANESHALLDVMSYFRERFSYQAIEFGVRGVVPQQPTETLRKKTGDCKDLAVLARALLRQHGVEAHVALVNTRQTINPEVPTGDQFNHVILYVPELTESGFVDVTSFHGNPFHVPDYLNENYALVLTEGTTNLVFVPSEAQVNQTVVIDREVKMDPTNAVLVVNDELTLGGNLGEYMRYYFANNYQSKSDEDWLSNVLWQHLDGFTIEKVTTTNLETVNEPLRLNLTYHKKISSSATPTLPAPWVGFYLDGARSKERTIPYYFRFNLQAKIRIQLEGPVRLQETMQPVTFDAQGLKAQMIKSKAQENTYLFGLSLEQGTYPADAFDGYQQQLTEALHALKLNVKP